MAGRFSRSWEIFKSSATVLSRNKILLVFPLFSFLAALIVIVISSATYWWLGNYDDATSGSESGIVGYIILFGTYLALYSVISFFNTAMVAATVKFMGGGKPTVEYGFRAAWSKIRVILGYACIAATVGVLLRTLEERLGFIGRFVIAVLGVVWTAVTFLVVPIIVHRDIGPLDAINESAALLKKTWGENIIASAGMGAFFALLYAPLVLIVIFTGGWLFYNLLSSGLSDSDWITATSVCAVALLTLLLLGLIHAALQSIYGAALYRYATNAHDEPGISQFGPEVLVSAFAPKRDNNQLGGTICH